MTVRKGNRPVLSFGGSDAHICFAILPLDRAARVHRRQKAESEQKRRVSIESGNIVQNFIVEKSGMAIKPMPDINILYMKRWIVLYTVLCNILFALFSFIDRENCFR